MYREVLRSSEEHKGRLKTDSLQVCGLCSLTAFCNVWDLHMKGSGLQEAASASRQKTERN